eukprot:5568582-Amphidinium_carterae.1
MDDMSATQLLRPPETRQCRRCVAARVSQTLVSDTSPAAPEGGLWAFNRWLHTAQHALLTLLPREVHQVVMGCLDTSSGVAVLGQRLVCAVCDIQTPLPGSHLRDYASYHIAQHLTTLRHKRSVEAFNRRRKATVNASCRNSVSPHLGCGMSRSEEASFLCIEEVDEAISQECLEAALNAGIPMSSIDCSSLQISTQVGAPTTAYEPHQACEAVASSNARCSRRWRR